jgi:hypothetical protein
MPDLESFIVTQKNQENLQAGIKRKKKAAGKESSDDEVIAPKKGSRSRPNAAA